ncbi:MAG TPA: EAL domain-containing protein [Acidimicrobiales bacterium]|nr:EAL domain-containing protein [Acidimicrobiales bacterium]
MTIKVRDAAADTRSMAETRLRSDASEQGQEPGQESQGLPPAAQLALFADLTHVVTWELEFPGEGVRWHAPVTRLFGTSDEGTFWLATNPGDDGERAVRAVAGADLGEMLLAPIVESTRAGLVWENYELVQELVTPDGKSHQVLVRAIGVSDGQAQRFFGIAAEVASADRSPWVASDVAERLQLLVEHSPDGIIVHQDGILVYGNAAAARIVGMDRNLGVGKPLTAFLHPEDIAPTVARLGQLRETGDVAKGHEARIVRADGSQVTVEVASVRTTWGGKPAYQVILHDISERKRAEKAAQARVALERRYAAAVAALEEGVVVIGRDGRVCAANDSAQKMLGRRLERGRGDGIFRGDSEARLGDGRILMPQELPIAIALERGESCTNVVVGVTCDDGTEQWLSINSRPLGETSEDDGAAVVCSVSDITERKELLDRLAWEARNDPLTGLANRTGLLAALRERMAGGERTAGGERAVSGERTAGGEPKSFALFFIDLDRFKLINDSLGHAAGDEVLIAVSERLRQVIPETATASRLHGDEFVILDSDIEDTDQALQRAEDLRAVISHPLLLSTGRTLTVTPSIGVVRLEGTQRDAVGLLQDADMAMLQAKSRGRGRVAMFDTSLREEAGSRLELENDLREAVKRGELRLEYQPIASLTNGRVLGLEALVRWEHPRWGLLLPAKFVGLAEESELIATLGRWVLTQGCIQMAQWRSTYSAARDAFLALNVSPRQLDGPDLLPALEVALEASGLPPSAVVLEITESGFVSDDPHIGGMLDDLRTFGVRLAIDDFGTGYSSLSYLKRLPVSYLKIDRAFVSGLGGDDGDRRIVQAITELGHGLGLRLIAEGVENRQQRDTARQLGCDLYQGYLLARPCRPRDVPDFWN